MMDLIAVDVGNSRISCALFRQGKLSQSWHHDTGQEESAAHQIASLSDGLVVAISSVVPESSREMARLLREQGRKVTELSPGEQTLLRGVYHTMGVDRIANAVAAWKLHGQGSPVVAVDLGSATTLTAVSADGRFCGGLITLGLGKTLNALHGQAALLPAVTIQELVPRDFPLGMDTPSAMERGTLHAQAGIIEHWIALGKQALGASTRAVGTGGWLAVVSQYTNCLDELDPDLTLKGIYLMAEAAAVLEGQD